MKTEIEDKTLQKIRALMRCITNAPVPVLLLTVLFFAFSGCQMGAQVQVGVMQDVPVSLMWPPPPEPPRIEYLYNISKPDDVGWSPSFFEKTIAFFAGHHKNRMMVRPYGIIIGPDEVLCVADPGARIVHKFYLKEKAYKKITEFSKQELVSPIGVALDTRGMLYVSDSSLRRIFVYDRKGKSVRKIGSDALLQRPTGIAIDPSSGRLYVVDTLAHAIKVFSLDGSFLFSMGKRGKGEGAFNYPTAITLDKDGNLYINDSMNFRVQIFKPDGTFSGLFGKHGDGTGEFSNPKGVALDSEGHIYVTDAIFDRVQVFNTAGELLLTFGEAGQAPGQFWIPTALYIDSTDRIFIADSYNKRVQVFKFLSGGWR